MPLLKKKKKEKGKHKAHKSSAKTNLSIIKEGLKSFIPLEKDIKGKPIHVSEVRPTEERLTDERRNELRSAEGPTAY